MANIPEDKRQISVTLPNVIIEKLEKLAEKNFYKRSEQAARIIIDYFKEIDEDKNLDKPQMK